jgi:Reverse transcriptase (RNA-dependent DNA polymerase)
MSYLYNKKFFSKLDLKSAYNQLHMHKGSQKLTALATPYGNYEYTVMPFGLCNAPAIFQRFITAILNPILGLNCQVYLDDIIVVSVNQQEHTELLKKVFSLLSSNGIIANAEKSQFYLKELDFLGHHITKEGIRPTNVYITKIQSLKSPKTKKDLQQLLGFLNYIQNYIKDYGRLVDPLYSLLKNSKLNLQ